MNAICVSFQKFRFAMKSIEIESSDIFIEEVEILKKLSNHANILNYAEDFSMNGCHCIITEYCEVSF